jgi:hypothetical protein
MTIRVRIRGRYLRVRMPDPPPPSEATLALLRRWANAHYQPCSCSLCAATRALLTGPPNES